MSRNLAGSAVQAGGSSGNELNRRAIFISHANPEDKAFTFWLGARLSAAGYEVWADVLHLLRGQDWQRQIEDAFRNKECKTAWNFGSGAKSVQFWRSAHAALISRVSRRSRLARPYI